MLLTEVSVPKFQIQSLVEDQTAVSQILYHSVFGPNGQRHTVICPAALQYR